MLDKLQINWRVGLKSLVIAVLVTVNLCAILLPLVPSTANAQAAPLSPTEKAKRYQAARYFGSCIQAPGLIKFRSLSDIKKGAIYRSDLDVTPINPTKEYAVGFIVDSGDNGLLTCADEGDQGIAMRSLQALGDGEDFFINSGVYKTTGSGDYEVTGGSDLELAAKFANYIGTEYGINLGGDMSDGSQYFSLKASFLKSCAEPDQPENKAGLPEVHMVDEATGELTVEPWLYNADKVEVPVGFGIVQAERQSMSCREIVDTMDLLDDLAVQEQKKFIDDGGTEESNTPGTEQDSNPTCESTGWLTWIVCPVINGLAEVADGAFEHFIEPMLSTPAVDIVNTDNPVFKVWVAMRNIANILLVVAMIVVVFGQAIGGGLVDAYTAKKVLPRILAAAIMINLSIYIVAFAVDITNVIGQGITQLMYFPFQSVDAFKFNISQGTAGLGIVGLVGAGGGIWLAAAAGTAFIPWLLLFVLLPLAIAMLGVLFTLVLRQGIIQFLIISSPIAFVLYCLPNTEQYFKKWWSLFMKTLLVYPIIMIIFAIADILAVTTDLAAANDPGATQLPAQIISIVLLVLPLFMIPYAFKLAGGAIGAIHGALTSGGKKGVNAIKGSETDPNSLRNSAKRRAREGRDAKLDRMLRGGKGPNATRRQVLAGHLADRLGGNINARMAEHTLRAQEREEMESKTGYDGYRYAANWFSYEAGQALPTGLKDFNGDSLNGQTATQRMFFDSKGRQIEERMARYSERRHGRSEHEVGRNLEYAMRKAKTDDDQANVRRAFRAAALRSGYTGKEIQDQHNRSFFEHKGEFGATYFSTPYGIDAAGNRIDRTDTTTKAVDIGWDDVADNTSQGRANQNTHVEEVHKARGQYDYSRMRDEDWRSWDTRRNRIQDELDAGHTITDQDAKFYAETNEILDAVTHTPVMMPGGSGEAEMSVTGVSAASQGVIKAMQANRRYETAAAPAGTTLAGGHTISSVNERVIYNKDQVARLTGPPPGTTATTLAHGPVMTKAAAIAHAARAATEVTGDADRTNAKA